MHDDDSTLKVYGVWHGGINYSEGSVFDHLERFDSLTDAAEKLAGRARSGHWQRQDFHYATGAHAGQTVSTYTPCADDGARIAIHLAGSPDYVDGDPDRYIELTDRGAVRDSHTGHYYSV